MDKKRILLVDDEPTIRLMVKSRLQSNGYDVVTASDGQECVDKVVTEKPDLLILDIMMPKMDGYQTIIALKEIQAMKEDELSLPPIIALSARADTKVKQMVKNEEIAGYVTKPFRSEELLDTIKQILGE